jgi:methylenetetrahydrofolate dehydrogenase (NADP+)/methenyltetrahydrofolate cyclohydrolase
MIRREWIKSGAIVIDVGIHRLPLEPSCDSADRNRGRLVDEVMFAEAQRSNQS